MLVVAPLEIFGIGPKSLQTDLNDDDKAKSTSAAYDEEYPR